MGLRDFFFGVPAQQPETRAQTFSISDPAFAEWLAMNGFPVGELTTERALGITAYYRGVAIISGTIAGLPLKTYREKPDGSRERVKSFLDKPAGPYPLTPFAWKELVMVHMLTKGETFLLHIYNAAGALIGLWPVHPDSVVSVEWRGTEKVFTVSMADGTQRKFTQSEMTHVPGLTLDGIRGISMLNLFRSTIQTSIATETAARHMATSGLMIAGLVTPETDIDEEEAKAIKRGLDAKVTGPDNAGGVAVINRNLKFTPWTMTADEAQFLQSREFNVIEFARMFGIPPHLLGATEKQTSWGTGVAEQNLGLARYTLMGWTSRLEEALSELLPNPRFTEFDYKGLLQGTPKDEIDLLISQVQAGIMTKDEARAVLNLPPLTAAQKAESAPPPPPAPNEPAPKEGDQ